MLINRLVFWEPSVSPHKTQLFKALKKLRPNVEVIHVAQAGVSSARKAMGWQNPLPDDYEEIISPNNTVCHAIASDRPHESFHVFSGMRHVPCIVQGLRVVKKLNVKFAIMSEPRVNEGIRGFFRFIHSWITEKKLRNQAACIFAIGKNGPPWFLSVGYSSEKIFPFAYFIDQLICDEVVSINSKAPIKIGYLGRLVRAKGIFTLLEAFELFDKKEATLKLVGPFDSEEWVIKSLIKKSKNNVRIINSIPMLQVASFLNELDVLVLPSNTSDDGWGVVITEALMIGIPVVVTTCVGASLILNDFRLGVVVKPNDSIKLVEAIRTVTVLKNLEPEMKKWRKNWAENHLSAEAGAKYFWTVLDHRLNGVKRPVPFYV